MNEKSKFIKKVDDLAEYEIDGGEEETVVVDGKEYKAEKIEKKEK